MTPPSPNQLVWRRRIEAGLRVVGPALDLVLAAGDRISRAVDRDEPDMLPAGPTNRTVAARSRRRVGPGAAARER